MKRTLPFALLASFAAPALYAQDHTLPADIAPYALTWPSGAGTGDFTRAVAGQFNGDGIPDVVQIRGTTATLFVSPAVFNTAAVLGSSGQSWTVIDADVLKGLGTNGNDALVFLDAQGLHIGRYNPAVTFDVAFTREDIVSPRWVGAQRVRVADLNADLAPDLIGVASDGLTVLQFLNDGQGHFTQAQDLTFTDAIVDVVALQWDLDTPLEIAVLNVRGVIVSEQNGTVREARPKVYSAGDSIAVIGQIYPTNPPAPPTPLMQRQRVAWARLSLDGVNNELLAFGTANALEGPYSLGAIGVSALTAGDFDRDGDSDLLLSEKQGKKLLTIINQRNIANQAAASFAPLETYERLIVNLTEAPIDTSATPLFFDLDNDGRADSFTARSTAAPAFSYALLLPAVPVIVPPMPASPTDTVGGHPAFSHADFVSAAVVAYERSGDPEHACEATPEDGMLFLGLNKAAWGTDADNANEIEITGWSQSDWEHNIPPDVNGYEHRHFLLSEANVHCPPTGSGPPCVDGGDYRIAIRIPEETIVFDTCYFIQVRLRNVTGNNVTNYRTYIAAFTGDFSNGDIPEGSCDYLIAQLGAWPGTIPYTDYSAPQCPFADKAHHLGGFVPQGRMPHFAPGATPQVPTTLDLGVPAPPIDPPPYFP